MRRLATLFLALLWMVGWTLSAEHSWSHDALSGHGDTVCALCLSSSGPNLPAPLFDPATLSPISQAFVAPAFIAPRSTAPAPSILLGSPPRAPPAS
ncbi:MAG: hypothetical protein QM758_23485 [Armatimonas sp.]